MQKFLTLFLLFAVFTSQAQKQTNERARWFVDSRFGMFIHWGLYSAAEGYWKGEKLRNDNDYAEWLFYRNQINKDEYETLLKRFDFNSIDPEQWVILAKKTGMKYITLTAKHHDGFALWNSKTSDYNIYKTTGRDIVAELAAACRKHGLKLGLYYSHWVDWEHPFGWNHEREISGIDAKQYDRYWQEKVIPQVRELLTNYGEISIMWFDMWLHHSRTCVTREQLLQLKSMIRELQPACLVNSRLGLSIEEDPDIDFKTLQDNQLGDKKEEFPWQSPGTVAHSWGYHATETQWKSTTFLLKSLIGNVSLNGNFMLNIGPRANGDVPYEISQRLLAMGNWLEINGEAIYGAGAFELDKNLHDWGKITARHENGKTRLFLHIYNYPLDKQLPLSGITSSPTKIYMLADKQKKQLTFTHNGPFTNIDLPVLQPDPLVSVAVVEYDGEPAVVQGLTAKNTEGGYSMTYANQINEKRLKINRPRREGTIPQCVTISSQEKMKWKFYIDKPGKYSFDISYNAQITKSGGKITCTTNGQTLSKTIEPTGKTVGEPHEDWVIDRFLPFRLGEIEINSTGLYEIELEINPPTKSSVEFQWLWVSKI